MENSLTVDVAALDASHRQALEEVLGRELAGNQRLLISISEVALSAPDNDRPTQTLDDWTQVYDGLNEEQIEAVDRIAKTRANLTRNLPSS